MPDKNDGRVGESNKKMKTYGEDGVAIFGNDDAKTLVGEYKKLSKDGITPEERKKLEKLDETLKGAKFNAISTISALVGQEDENSYTNFSVLADGIKQTARFIDKKPGRNK